MASTEVRDRFLKSDCEKTTNIDTEMGKKEDEKDKTNDMRWFGGDSKSVFLLFLLYILQGVPLGISGSIPMLLASQKISYQQQAAFSFVFWPFSLKLLWAPIVDGAYSRTFGRRKSWLIPTQYVIAATMWILSMSVDKLLYGETLNIFALTVCFFLLNFGAATQDIAVDGWALTMLSRKNVGLASTCNSVGQTAGYFLGNVIFLALESEDFCNNYIRFTPQEGGIVTLASYLKFWAVVFTVVTTMVMLLKRESTDDNESSDSVWDSYKQLVKIIRLPAVLQYAIILLTCKVGFAPEPIAGLKLIELGVKQESMALLAVPLTPIQICLPLLISKYTSGPRPMDIFLKSMAYRLAMGAVFAFVVHLTPAFRSPHGDFPASYFVLLLAVYALHQVALYGMFVAMMAFNAKVSDPRIGGTYMTLLNTVANLGGNWPNPIAMMMADKRDVHYCENALTNFKSCYSNSTVHECESAGGRCQVSTIDGYYVTTCVCLLLGVAWMRWRGAVLARLQSLSPQRWKAS